MYNLNFSPAVNNDFTAVLDYIRNTLENPAAAENHYEALLHTLRRLEENPLIRPTVQDAYLAGLGYHSIHVKNYLLFYTIDDDAKKVNLVRFMHSTRDWIGLLSDNDSESEASE
jgi:toxin ParE1/3/4